MKDIKLLTLTGLLLVAGWQLLPDQTQFTSELLDGVPVITQLNTSSLALGKKHNFYFRTVRNNVGQYWYLPVTVIRGKTEGKRLVITAGIHGNEYNGLAVTARLASSLDPQRLNGTVVLVHQLNIPGLLSNFYHYKPTGTYRGVTFATNGNFPGDAPDATAASRHLDLLWRQLLVSNADYAIDLHATMKNFSTMNFVMSDLSSAAQQDLARALASDLIVHDKGQKATIETTFSKLGRPSATVEIGVQEKHDGAAVSQAVNGIKNYLAVLKMLPNEKPSSDPIPIVNRFSKVKAVAAGLFEPFVEAGQAVAAGDLLGKSYDQFGLVVKVYYAPLAGTVLGRRNLGRVEKNSHLVEIVYSQR